jgi:hypothetical protein
MSAPTNLPNEALLVDWKKQQGIGVDRALLLSNPPSSSPLRIISSGVFTTVPRREGVPFSIVNNEEYRWLAIWEHHTSYWWHHMRGLPRSRDMYRVEEKKNTIVTQSWVVIILMRICWEPPRNRLTTAWLPPDYRLTTAWKPTENRLKTAWKPPECLPTVF